MCEGRFHKLAHGMGFAGCEHKVVAFIVLKDSPHAFDIFGRVTPVALRIEVAEKQFILQIVFDGGNGARNFARDESFAAPRALVVEQDAVTRVKAVALAIIHRRPERKNFCDAVRAARPEGRFLGLRHLLCLAEHFAAGGLIKPCTSSRFPDCFEYPNRPDPGDVGCVLGNVETDADMALRAEMVNFVRLQFVEQLHQAHRVTEISEMEKHAHAVDMRVGVEMIDA